MIEVRLRAWDSHLEVMVHDIHRLDNLNEYLSSDRYKITQWTGGRDSLGRDIYGGDCLVVGVDDEFVGVVYFDDDLLAFCVEQASGGLEYLGKYLIDNKGRRVGGTVYENQSMVTETLSFSYMWSQADE